MHYTQQHGHLLMLDFVMALIGALLFGASPLSDKLGICLNRRIASFWACKFLIKYHSISSFIVGTKISLRLIFGVTGR